MKKNLLFLFLFFCSILTFAQQDAWVYLTDKDNVAESISNPISILTQKSIDRKLDHNIEIDERDVPVNESYIAQLKSQTGITVLTKSKWFNAVHVRGTQSDIEALSNLSFVSNIDFADKNLNSQSRVSIIHNKFEIEETYTNFNYGAAQNQIEMFNGDELHLADYTGDGMTIAVLDAGFPNVHTMSSFQRLREAGNILGTYDFVDRDNDVYTNTTSSHGTLVLSDMAGYVQDQFVGTAPDASYYLFITEDAPNENPVEESYWVEAAERADSLGVNVINTSLGYTTYDNPNYNYTTADMDGNTAFISRGANIAFEKGMLLVNSAGNSGNGSWGIVGAPADASGVLSVGAVDANGDYATFSSRGNGTQSNQKPDVVAQGQASYVITQNDIITTANGTSFSSPILAGGVTCLWQALPSLTNMQIMQLVRESASQHSNPDNFLGFGIPDLQIALNNGLSLVEIEVQELDLRIYPNPISDKIFLSVPEDERVSINIFNILGKLVLESYFDNIKNGVNVSELSGGIYIAKLQAGDISNTIKLIKSQ
ncbi:MAG: S8 family serine peptidase [Bacteroidia bacterium]|nr:S8 family serine peptidase [Bacteroidia bacterium]